MLLETAIVALDLASQMTFDQAARWVNRQTLTTP